jgi:hypothetical protein
VDRITVDIYIEPRESMYVDGKNDKRKPEKRKTTEPLVRVRGGWRIIV